MWAVVRGREGKSDDEEREFFFLTKNFDIEADVGFLTFIFFFHIARGKHQNNAVPFSSL